MATCGARTKSCRSCGHRYVKGDRSWTCPECGEDRHCRRPVKREGDRCRFHGGRSLKGVDAPAFKDGRRSKYLPERLAARYEEASADPELLGMRSEVALLDARLYGELMAQIKEGESGPAWGRLKGLYRDLRKAMDARDPAAMGEALAEMGDVIEDGVNRQAAWAEAYDVADRIRKLKEGEYKRMDVLNQMITAERANVMVARVLKAVVDNVSDPDERAEIAADLRSLTL